MHKHLLNRAVRQAHIWQLNLCSALSTLCSSAIAASVIGEKRNGWSNCSVFMGCRDGVFVQDIFKQQQSAVTITTVVDSAVP